MNYKGFVFSKQLNFDNVKHKNQFQLRYYQFYIINIIVVDILFISLIHYTRAVEVGLRELFSFHIAMAVFMGSNYCNYNKSRLKYNYLG